MMASISSKIHYKEARVILIERNDKLGIKLRLTGGGRCNVTANVSNETVIENTPKNGKFLFSSLSNFSSKDIINFFESLDCRLKTEDHDRVFPVSNKSIDIVNTLKRKIESLGIIIKYNSLVKYINYNKSTVKTDTESIIYDHLIIATGGKTYPLTGSDGIGYELAKGVGHTITSLIPAEVPLVSNDKVIEEKTLQGLSFKDVRLDVLRNGKLNKSITHDLIFTHFGLSGPGPLRSSFYVQRILEKDGIVNINIDFLPKVTHQEMQTKLNDELDKFIISNAIPKRLLDYIKTKEVNNQDIINMIKKFPISVYTTRGFTQAFVTNGGISIKEIDPKTMISKINNNISFCGEIMDINSFTGGYNITSAFSTGYTAGKYALDCI